MAAQQGKKSKGIKIKKKGMSAYYSIHSDSDAFQDDEIIDLADGESGEYILGTSYCWRTKLVAFVD